MAVAQASTPPHGYCSISIYSVPMAETSKSMFWGGPILGVLFLENLRLKRNALARYLGKVGSFPKATEIWS